MASHFQYTTVSYVKDVVKALSSLSDWTDGEIEKRINEAEDDINSKLKSKFSIPFTAGAAPYVIQDIAKNIAGANCVRDLYANQTQKTSELETKLRDYANSQLDKILSGELAVLDNAGGVIASEDMIASFTEQNSLDPKFGVDDEFGIYREGNNR